MNGRLVLMVGSQAAAYEPWMRNWGYEPRCAASVTEAVAVLTGHRFLFTLVDAVDGDAEHVLEQLEPHAGDAGPTVLLTEDPNSPAVRRADLLVPKPATAEELEAAVKRLLARPRRVLSPWADEDARLRYEMALCSSPKMQEIWQIVEQAAGVDVTVLVRGETGTGKDLVARAIHRLSARRDKPFVKVNCAAVPRELLETELFGHERGAFTGAHQLKIGKFEAANHGTVFLDEIGDLHPALQAKLLHVLQDGSFSRVGGRSTIEVDVRILSATNQDLERAVAAERFREDLYYRLNVVQIVVPPLRERVEEIPELVEYFVQRYSELFKRRGFAPAPTAIERLLRHPYPGNVRELENIIKRMIVLSDSLLVRTPLLVAPGRTASAPALAAPLLETLSLKTIARGAARAAEREAIAKVLKQTNWNRVKAAKLLKISYRALLYKIKDVGLARDHASVRADA